MHESLRCGWADGNKPGYIEYHDTEWGVPVHDDIKHFEMLILEGAQAGLSWYTILKRRDGYREAFKGFNPILVAQMSDFELEQILGTADVIRHKGKIFSARQNAIVFLEIQKEFGSFDDYIWGFVNGKTIQNNRKSLQELTASSQESDIVSKDLKKRGMKFIGSTIIYAYMQAAGLVNDHLLSCKRHKEVKVL